MIQAVPSNLGCPADEAKLARRLTWHVSTEQCSAGASLYLFESRMPVLVRLAPSLHRY